MKLIKFHADWCGPCKPMAQVVHDLSEQQNLDVASVDIDEHPEIAAEFGVRSIPTVILVDDHQKELARAVGSMPMKRLASELGL